MLVVHHLNNSRSQRILWLLEELELEYEIKFYERDAKTMLAPESAKELHPLGKFPVFEDERRKVAESGAIIEYVVDEHGGGQLRPEAGTDDYYRYRYWLHYAEGSAMPPLLLKLITTQVKKKAPLLVRPIAKGVAESIDSAFTNAQLKTHFSFVDGELGKSEWLVADEFTAADIQMSFPLEAVMSRGDGSRFPNIAKFVERIHARPAYKRALERGGPYEVG